MSGKPFPFVWTRERTARLIKAWNGGLTGAALAERFGLSEASVYRKVRALRASGVELRMGENARTPKDRSSRALGCLRLTDQRRRQRAVQSAESR